MSTTEKHAIYVGFAFSMNKDSSPGDYNRDIAKCMLDSWDSEKGPGEDSDKDKPIWIGVQWELYDALEERRLGFARANIPEEHVAGPPLFRKEDLAGERVALLRHLLRDTELPEPQRTVMELLRTEISNILSRMPPHDGKERQILFPDQLAALLNRVVLEGKFLKNVIDAALNPKPKLDETKFAGWKEERTLPEPGNEMGRFQSRRLSRIIIDWLFKEETDGAMKAAYLNTVQVCVRLFEQVATEGVTIDSVKVFGFPEHGPRCTANVLQTLWLNGRLAEQTAKEQPEKPSHAPISVIDVNSPKGCVDLVRENQDTELPRAGNLKEFPWRWYPDTAQQWCQTRECWQRHEKRLPPP